MSTLQLYNQKNKTDLENTGTMKFTVAAIVLSQICDANSDFQNHSSLEHHCIFLRCDISKDFQRTHCTFYFNINITHYGLIVNGFIMSVTASKSFTAFTVS